MSPRSRVVAAAKRVVDSAMWYWQVATADAPSQVIYLIEAKKEFNDSCAALAKERK